MRDPILKSAAIIACALLFAAGAAPAGDPATVGGEAPRFTGADTTGESRSLSELDGKVVVLEWVNPDCPFVQRHAKAGTMKRLAEDYGARGVVWMAVNSTHYMDPEASAQYKDAHDLPYPIVVDRSGEIGRMYHAKTTPHMFIIDTDGTLVYAGAIDDDPRGSKQDAAVNYVAAALDELLAGTPISAPETQPYGCSVKYAK